MRPNLLDCAQWYGAAMSMVFIQIKHVYCLVIGQVIAADVVWEVLLVPVQCGHLS